MSLKYKREMAAMRAVEQIGGATIFKNASNQRLVEMYEEAGRELYRESRRLIKTSSSKTRVSFLESLLTALEYECGKRSR